MTELNSLTSYADGQAMVWHGDNRALLAALPDNSVDSVVTDPPYELTTGKKGGTGKASVNLDSPYGRARIGTGNGAGGFMGKSWDATGIAHDPTFWAECLRVLKPGGHLLAFGGSRTWHRLAVAIEDGGFELRDSIAWLYGSGFPKSLDVSKAIDKAAGVEREPGEPGRPRAEVKAVSAYQDGVGNASSALVTAPATPDAERWQGWGTALKPAFEPIVVGRKPLAGTVAANVLEHGTGALNIDGCRIGDSGGGNACAGGDLCKCVTSGVSYSPTKHPVRREGDFGRWPANVVLDESQAEALDEQSGTLKSGANPEIRGGDTENRTVYGGFTGARNEQPRRGTDSGGASRFFYVAKAPKKERPVVDGVAHPTVKPLALMRWCIRLITPPGGLVLDTFTGSGTTGEAALLEGFRFLGAEAEADYLPLIAARMERVAQPEGEAA